MAIASCTISFSVLAATGDYNLPSIGQPADVYLSPAKEQKLGRQVVAQLLERGLIVEDIQLEQYISRVGRRLARHTSRAAGDFHFYLIDQPQINAFALPGGYIGVNAGLVTQTDNESQLASVMAHEIAHVTQRHIARQIQATSGTQWATLAAVLAAAIAGGDADATSAAITAGMAHLGQQQIDFTRAHEHEADRVGIRTLAAADYDPDAMAGFFEKLRRRSHLYGQQLPQILLTHPVSNTRMAEAESRAKRYSGVQVRPRADYALMKERARVGASNQLGRLLEYYRHKRDNSTRPALDYGYALVLTRLGRTAQAIDLLQPLVQAHPTVAAYPLALADAYSKGGSLERALKQLDATRQRFTHSTAAKLDYARALVATDEIDTARSFLLAHEKLTQHVPQAQQLLARAAGKRNRLGEAYYRQARYHEMRGDFPRAINQLRTALQTADLGAFDTARLRALLKQTVQACHTAWSAAECRARVREESRY